MKLSRRSHALPLHCLRRQRETRTEPRAQLSRGQLLLVTILPEEGRRGARIFRQEQAGPCGPAFRLRKNKDIDDFVCIGVDDADGVIHDDVLVAAPLRHDHNDVFGDGNQVHVPRDRHAN